ncbi:cyclase family protein [[Clostridium] hylemonae]|uniref:Cyclase n=1 Tax=[Clostridium] hylemonae DSM 15053 TaxID=553973 RepID=C0C5R3_9FIRM|nr:cyclase family protein [[Clostridium] hylemonae]EEG72447.1 putative cyclase [[Clostridium] hylemonae DSM 15053]MCB7521992.1 cyclase family protein [[Clostridium] hylemonae]
MLIELSYVISEHVPKWPTNPEEKYDYNQAFRFGDTCNASSVYHHLHTGTHVDAPFHFDKTGRTIDEIPAEDFYYTAPLVLKLMKSEGERVELAELKVHEEEIAKCDILFLYTGYSDLRESSPEKFVSDFPSMAPDAARYLRKNFPGLKAVALDSISFDSAVTGAAEGFPSHHALLETNEEQTERTLLLYEDVNIKKLAEQDTVRAVCAFPVRFAGLEAGPVNMVAIV